MMNAILAFRLMVSHACLSLIYSTSRALFLQEFSFFVFSTLCASGIRRSVGRIETEKGPVPGARAPFSCNVRNEMLYKYRSQR